MTTNTDELASMWETTSGLPLDGARVTITRSTFGFNAQIGAGVTCWNAEFTNEEGTTGDQSFSVGANGGEPNRDGSELVNGAKSFSGRSNYGRMIDSAREILGSPEKCAEVIGDPHVAENWIGTEWTLGTVKTTGQNPQTKEKVEKDSLVFTEFHGKEGSDAKPAGKASGKASASKGKAKAAAHGDVDEDLWNELVELAGQHEDHEDFMEAALALEDVDNSVAAQKAVIGTRDGSVWKAAH